MAEEARFAVLIGFYLFCGILGECLSHIKETRIQNVRFVISSFTEGQKR